MNDERLRQLYMQGLAARERQHSRAGAPCAVSPDDLLALARGDLAEERRLELLDRVLVNERCRRELDLLRAVVTAEREALAAEADAGDAGPDETEEALAGEPAEEPAPARASYPAPPALRVVRGGAGQVAEPGRTRVWWRSPGITGAIAA